MFSTNKFFARAAFVGGAIALCGPAVADPVTLDYIIDTNHNCSTKDCGTSPYGKITVSQSAPGQAVQVTVQLSSGDFFAKSSANDAFAFSFNGTGMGNITGLPSGFSIDSSTSGLTYNGDPFGIFIDRIAYTGKSDTVSLLQFSFAFSGTLSASDFSASINPNDTHSFFPALFAADINYDGIDPPVAVLAAVPETSTWAMMIFGFLGVGILTYKKNRKPRFA